MNTTTSNDNQRIFVESLIKRIESLLPFRTGHSFQEVELDPQFILTKKLLLNNYYQNSDTITYVLTSFTSLLLTINNESQNVKIKYRDEKSRSSTLLACKILVDILKTNWNRKTNIIDEKDLMSNCSRFYYYDAPLQLDRSIIIEVLNFFLNLLSSGIVKRVLALIRNEQSLMSTTSTKDDEILKEDQPLTEEESILASISEIDSYVELILRYIATANPDDYYNFIYTKLFSYSINNQTIPLPIIQKYCPLIKYIYLSKRNLIKLTNESLKALPFIKSNTWKQVYLFFLASSLKDQFFSRTSDYESIIDLKDSNHTNPIKQLFDAALSIFEENYNQSLCAPFILTWYLVLCVEDFNEMNSIKPLNKLKLAFNKRLKYLSTILKESSNGTNLESFDSLINIFHLGTRLDAYGYKQNPVLIFSLRHLDEVYIRLKKYCEINREKLLIEEDLQSKYEYIMVNFYIAAVILRPEKYTKILIDYFFNGNTDIKVTKIFIKTIRGLSEIETAHNIFYKLIEDTKETLRNIIFGAMKILHNYELQTNHIGNVNELSNQSIYSDATSVDENELRANQATNMFMNSTKTGLDHYIQEFEKSKEDKLFLPKPSSASISSTNTYFYRLAYDAEELLSDIFMIFVAAPEFYFNDMKLMNDENLKNIPYSELLNTIIEFCHKCVIPLRQAFKIKPINQENSRLFESSKNLSMQMVLPNTKIATEYTDLSAFANFNICNCIIQSLCETCLGLALIDPKFKSSFLFLNDFLHLRNNYSPILLNNPILADPESRGLYETCGAVIQAVEKVLLLSSCTHDIQFYNYAKQGIKWYINEIKNNNALYAKNEVEDTLLETFELMNQDEGVFTGFVSLQKRHRKILREAKPTKSLYYIWLIILARWTRILRENEKIHENNAIFRHFTGFLVSTSGCFISATKGIDPEQDEIYNKGSIHISEFFDKCIDLLNSQDLVVRVIVKDTLSNESHSDVYHIIATKLMSRATEYLDMEVQAEESIVFLEQAMIIMTAMINVGNDGALLLSSLLPHICQFFIRFINKVEDTVYKLRLKLRFCKLAATLEQDKTNSGLKGAYKLRNYYSKAILEWLELAVILEKVTPEEENSRGRTSEIVHLKMDLAVQCSKTLRLQLEDLLLEVPEGIKDEEVKKYKDLSFGNYFSIFYKIIQKYTELPSSSRIKHKFQQVTDNVLSSITNLLQYDWEIGIQYLLPMGYHENRKIRGIFLNVFASMLTSQTVRKLENEFPDQLVLNLVDQTDIFSSIADCASSLEHNLLASSLFGIFSYTNKLDELFHVLLTDEITKLNRSTDLFRRNSTLTRLLFNFTQDHGIDYLCKILLPTIQEIVSLKIHFEVEKRESIEDSDLFIKYFTKIVDSIVDSLDNLPCSFKFVCGQIYQSVSVKFQDSALIAVGSFLFLRFLCPALISPEQFFKIPIENSKTKRSLMQLVKVLQNMANGTVNSIKWPGLSSRIDVLNSLNNRIVEFLTLVSTSKGNSYPFQKGEIEKPIAELRYLHKFIYTYFTQIRMNFLLGKSAFNIGTLHERVTIFKAYDEVVKQLRQPKPSVKLQLNSTLKIFDVNNNNEEDIKFNDFMTKMSLKYADTPQDCVNLIHSSIFKDATPVIVINLRKLKSRPDDVKYLVYKLFETASQIWDNNYYLIYDFSEFYFFKPDGPPEYTHLLSYYSPKLFFSNCKRVYYFNVPRTEYVGIIDSMKSLRKKGAEYNTQIFIHSSVDSDHIVNSLCLDPETVSISRDAKVTYKNVLLYEPTSGRFAPVYLKIGRKFLTVCFQERVKFKSELSATESFTPVEVYRLSEFNKCEASNYTGHDDEFTIFFSHTDQITFRSSDRLEILRFLYFTSSRLSKDISYTETEKDYRNEIHTMHWFGRLYNIVFQGLLSTDNELKSSAAILFGAMSSYFEIDFGITEEHAKSLPFPTDATSMVVSVSKHLSKNFPEMTYRFFKAYFDNFEKMEQESRLCSIIYISPWINNIYDSVHSQSGINGPDRVADIIRQFCRISFLNKDQISFINDYIWKKLFFETRLVSSLVDEVVAFAIDKKNEGPDWSFIISVITPSVEVCGEVISRLMTTIKHTLTTDSAIASQSKLFEITVLIKICSSLFFSSYTLAKLYLADLIFFVTLFIDDLHLEVGSDLRNMIISAVQSFLHKPKLTNHQQKVINSTIEYFSSPRAKMLFGMTRDLKSSLDVGQSFNRIMNFEILCDYLNEFIQVVSTSDDKTHWKARWSSNAIDVAFNNYSLFQDRAIVIVGILSKTGVTDSIACRTIKLVAHGELHSIDTVICVSIAVARIINGLPSSSMFPPIIVWPQLCYALLNHSILYQSALQNIITTMVTLMNEGPDYIDKAYAQRDQLEPYLSNFENKHGIGITKENFGVHIFYIVTQGLKYSQYRHLAITSIKTYFKKRYELRNARPIHGSTIADNAYAYLVFIFLCADSKEFEEYLIEDLKLNTEYYQIDKNLKIPQFLLNFLFENNDASKLVLIHLGSFFSDAKGVDVNFKSKFISLYEIILSKNKDAALLVYHIIQPALNQDLMSTVSLDFIEKISNIILTVSKTENYSPEKYINEIETILTTNKLLLVKKLRELYPVEYTLDDDGRFRPTFDVDIKTIQLMLYRAACTHIEGYKLEN
ncbi:IRA2 [Candida pseudojiufengensis]|uniref:IRA2 n=1 Tax=Candida pseudojiufengensis TaxID=497109 RepID=UPI0022250423|nr:IRA2 [Candida pseudojiufengensis]KAI5961403.1 IRA2 [Candida pseudojiufengensis]